MREARTIHLSFSIDIIFLSQKYFPSPLTGEGYLPVGRHGVRVNMISSFPIPSRQGRGVFLGFFLKC
jgi:hypothetical protein